MVRRTRCISSVRPKRTSGGAKPLRVISWGAEICCTFATVFQTFLRDSCGIAEHLKSHPAPAVPWETSFLNCLYLQAVEGNTLVPLRRSACRESDPVRGLRVKRFSHFSVLLGFPLPKARTELSPLLQPRRSARAGDRDASEFALEMASTRRIGDRQGRNAQPTRNFCPSAGST
jgi:hypothetical protein